MEFVKLESQEDLNFSGSSQDIETFDLHQVELQPKIPKTEQSTPLMQTFELNKPEFKEEDPDSIPVKCCEKGSGISCPDNSGYFKVENLFSELKTDYDKLVARTNLGLGTELSLMWGNIKGNLVNQQDLVNFILDKLQAQKIDIINTFEEEISKFDVEPVITTLFYGPDLDHMTLSDKRTFTTGDYDGCIYVLVPNINTDFEVNGLIGGFYYVNESITIGATKYYLFRSTYTGLGNTKITVLYNE